VISETDYRSLVHFVEKKNGTIENNVAYYLVYYQFLTRERATFDPSLDHNETRVKFAKFPFAQNVLKNIYRIYRSAL